MPKDEGMAVRDLIDKLNAAITDGSRQPLEKYEVVDTVGTPIRGLWWDHENQRLVLSDAG